MKRGILIDLGDTVFSNIDLSMEVVGEYLYEMIRGIKPSRDQFFVIYRELVRRCYRERQELEVPFQSFLRTLSALLHIKFITTNELLEIGFMQSFARNMVIQDVDRFLRFCKRQKLKVVALSNSAFSKATLSTQLASFGLLSYFNDVLSSADYIFRKPSPAFFEVGISVLNYPKEDILFIGNDYEIDMKGGMEAGLECAWFCEKPEGQTIPAPSFVFHTYRDLINRLKEEETHV
jgi:FMN phosphatase YigB (HAD superfamily)